MAQAIVEAAASSDLPCEQSFSEFPWQDLRAGTTIVCDRYAFSGVAYSAAKGGTALTTVLARSEELRRATTSYVVCPLRVQDWTSRGARLLIAGCRARMASSSCISMRRCVGSELVNLFGVWAFCCFWPCSVPQVGAARSNFGDERYENAAMQAG